MKKRGHRRVDGGKRQGRKSQWGPLEGVWVPHDFRDTIIGYLKHWADRAEIPCNRLLNWAGLETSKFHNWKKRYGKINEPNGQVPRDWWLEEWENQAMLDLPERFPLDSNRPLKFMMLDDNIVALSPNSVYRVLKAAGRMDRKFIKPSKKGTG